MKHVHEHFASVDVQERAHVEESASGKRTRCRVHAYLDVHPRPYRVYIHGYIPVIALSPQRSYSTVLPPFY